MSEFLPDRNASTYSPGSWSDGWRAQYDRNLYATTTTLPDNLDLYGYDLADLPSSCDIDGIEITLDARWDDSAGAGSVPTIKIYLSWDAGVSWTASLTTPTLTTSEARYYLGGHATDWGHTWTRAEMQSDKFRVRVQSSGIALGTPVWMVDWAGVTVHYTDTSLVELSSGDVLGVRDKWDMSRKKLSFGEQVVLAGGGTKAGTDNYRLSGDATEFLEEDADNYDAVAASRVREETVQLTFFLGTKRAGEEPHSIWITETGTDIDLGSSVHAHGAIAEFGDYSRGISWGAQPPRGGVKIRLRNGPISGRVLTGGSLEHFTKTVGQLFRDTTGEGESVTLFAAARIEGGEWYRRFLGHFTITGIDGHTESFVDVELTQDLRMDRQFPEIVVDEDLLDYGDWEGELPEEWISTVVPIGLGQFSIEGALYLEPNDVGIVSHAAKSDGRLKYFFPAFLGIKHPMMPLVMCSDRWKGDAVFDAGLYELDERPSYSIFVHGDKRRQPHCKVRTHSDLAQNNWYQQFPVNEAVYEAGPANHGNNVNRWHKFGLWSWNKQLDRGVAFAVDASPRLPGIEGIEWPSMTYDEFRNMIFSTRGEFATEITGARDGRYVEGVMIRREHEKRSGAAESIRLPLPHRVVALSPPSRTIFPRNIGGDVYHTTIPADAWNDLDDILDPNKVFRDGVWAKVQALETIAVDLAPSFSSLGEISAISLSFILANPVAYPTSPDDIGPHQLSARWTPQRVATLYPAWNTEEALGLARVHFDPTASTGAIVGGGYYEAMLVVHNKPAADGTRPNEGGFTAPWSFTAYDYIIGELAGPSQKYYSGMRLSNLAHTGGGKYDYYVQAIMQEVYFQDDWAQLPSNKALAGLLQQYREDPNKLRLLNYRGLTGGLVRGAVDSEPRVEEIAKETFYICGDGPRDSASRYGSVPEFVQNPVAMVLYLIDFYLGDTEFTDFVAHDSDFGSLDTAYDLMASEGLGQFSVVVDKKVTFRQFCARITKQSMVAFNLLPADNKEKWHAFVDLEDPATDDPTRVYGSPHYFTWDDFAPGSFEVGSTETEDIVNRHVLRYGFHLPSGTWAGRLYLHETATNMEDGTPSNATYVAACAASQTAYGLTREREYEAPDLWLKSGASRLLRYRADATLERRVTVQFHTYMTHAAIMPGHVIYFHDDVGDRVTYPGLKGAAGWSTHQFNVVSVDIEKDPGAPGRIKVTAIETYSRP